MNRFAPLQRGDVLRQTIEHLGVVDGHHTIKGPMYKQNRRDYVLNSPKRFESILENPSHWQEWIQGSSDING
jgi:hypothetical protein